MAAKKTTKKPLEKSSGKKGREEKHEKKRDKNAKRNTKKTEKKNAKKNTKKTVSTSENIRRGGGRNIPGFAGVSGQSVVDPDVNAIGEKLDTVPDRRVPLDPQVSDNLLQNATFALRAKTFEDLDSRYPVLMLPIRLETRFYLNQSTQQLKIRVFPDQIWIDAHEERLTEKEYQIGKRFWAEIKTHTDDSAAQNELWSWLVAKFGAQRAPWIARRTQNAVETNLRINNEQSRSIAPLLPERWFAVGYVDGNRVLEAFSNTLSDDLPFSPDMNYTPTDSDDLAVDPELKWLFDFDLAYQKGMAIKADLDDNSIAGLDELYVFGIRTKDPENETEKLKPNKLASYLEDLFSSQHYTRGGGFVPQGTPSNNTEESEAGWSAFDANVEAIRLREFPDVPDGPAELATAGATMQGALLPTENSPDIDEEAKNYRVLEKALGFKSGSILKRFEFREGLEKPAMESMNSALWEVSLGEYIGSLLASDAKAFFAQEDSDWIKDWFIDRVKGGASLPVIRFGETAYGVLLAQSFTRTTLRDANQMALLDVLNRLQAYWRSAAEDLVRLSGSSQSDSEPGDRLLELLSLQPNPVEFATRYLSIDDFWVLSWYELVKAAITDASISNHAETLEGVCTNVDLAALGSENFSSLDEQQDAYTNLQNNLSKCEITYQDNLDNLSSSDSNYQSLKDSYESILESIAYMLNHVDSMLDLLEDHGLTIWGLSTVGVPLSVLTGVVESGYQDPVIAFSRYRNEAVEWPDDRLVIVKDAEEIVLPEEYIGYLKIFARSYNSANIEVGTSPFNGKSKPLLYRLLYTAIARAGSADDASGLLMGELLDAHRNADDESSVNNKLDALKPETLDTLVSDVVAVRTGSATESSAGLQGSLRGASSTELRTLSGELRKSAGAGLTEASLETSVLGLADELDALSEMIDTTSTGLPDLEPSLILNQRIIRMVADLDLLVTLPWDQLELLMQQSLGLVGWRLDAWYTALASKRLDTMREKRARGLQLGAFGWVEDLRPRSTDTTVSENVSQGYIHTPSLNHAKTAAVLRAGWMAYGDEQADSAIAVDLSSDRIRTAAWLFDAVRQGQDLGDALGYRFERRLHEDQNDHWIYPVRKAVVEHTQQDEDPLSPVVDGMELHALWDGGNGRNTLESLTQKHFDETAPSLDEIVSVLEAIESSVDAMSDAAIADSVHALLQGNTVRAGSTLAAISRGEVPAPELLVANTTRKGMTLTHRVALLAPADENDFGWFETEQAAALSPRAMLDPYAESLVAGLLGKLDDIQVAVGFIDERAVIQHQMLFSFSELMAGDGAMALGAQDLLALLPGENIQASHALQRWLVLFLSQNRPVDVDASWQAVLLFDDEQEALNISSQTLLWLQAWRDVVNKSRALELRDFQYDEVEDENAGEVQIAELETRVRALRESFSNHIDSAQSLLPAATEEDPYPQGDADEASLQAALLSLSRFNLPQAIPAVSSDGQRIADYHQQLWSVLASANKMLSSASQIVLDGTPGTADRIANARELTRVILGKTQSVMLAMRPPRSAQVAGSLAKSSQRLDGDSSICLEWLERIGYVRPALKQFSETLMFHDALEKSSADLNFVVGQWPDIDGEKWAALNKPEQNEDGRLSLLAIAPAKVNIDQLDLDNTAISGLLIDEIVERLPMVTEDTGVTMHFDSPNTEAPQTLLLALAPENTPWDVDLMIDTLRDTFEAAQLRAVDGDLLPEFDHHLPAVFASSGMVSET